MMCSDATDTCWSYPKYIVVVGKQYAEPDDESLQKPKKMLSISRKEYTLIQIGELVKRLEMRKYKSPFGNLGSKKFIGEPLWLKMENN